MDEKKLLNILYYLAGQGYGDNTVWEIIDQKEQQEAKKKENELLIAALQNRTEQKTP